MHQYLVGGGFGGNQDYDDILAAAYCVKELGRPVKLIQTRESQFATSFPRTPTFQSRLQAGIKGGQLTAMEIKIDTREGEYTEFIITIPRNPGNGKGRVA